MDRVTQLKQQVGHAAADEIQSGMIVGLGSGSTAVWMVRRLAERLNAGELTDIVGIPTSTGTEAEAKQLGIPLTTLTEHPVVDLVIDGADEIDPALNLIKGGGGALLREKIVAQAAKRIIIVADDRKKVARLGTTFKLPVEVIRFGYASQRRFLEGLGCTVTQRMTADDTPYLTDSDNYIFDCDFTQVGGIADLEALAQEIVTRAGVVEHGLFLGMAEQAIVATEDGIERLTK